MDLNEYTHLQDQIKSKQSEVDRLRGALDAAKADLKKETGCTDMKSAKAQLEALTQEELEAQTLYQQRLAKFERKWKDALSPL
jgi:multidrug resistance efflux pump